MTKKRKSDVENRKRIEKKKNLGKKVEKEEIKMISVLDNEDYVTIMRIMQLWIIQ